ncbi:hypothetical protein LTR81_026315 [Elasticomyces elasticus]
MSGNIAPKHGWHSFLWLKVTIAAFVTLLLVVAFLETLWRRNSSIFAGAGGPKLESEAKSEVSIAGQVVGKDKPSRAKWSPIQKPESRSMTFVIRDSAMPFIAFLNPIVFWAALMLMGPADLLLIFNLTDFGLFGSPTSDLTSGAVGHTSFALFIGGIIGLWTAGPLSDWWARWATLRNNGIREAEMRLPALLPYCCIFVASHVVGAVGCQHLWPWQAIFICGFGFSGLAVTAMPTIAIAYAVDCYKPISGERVVVATVLKNVLGFCLSYWVFQVQAESDWIAVYMTQFAVDMLPVLLTIPLYFLGKNLRTWRGTPLHRMEALIC